MNLSLTRGPARKRTTTSSLSATFKNAAIPTRAVATGPALFDDELNSIKFLPERDHTCMKVRLGGTNVLVWKPDEVIDDSSLMQLNADLGFEGMRGDCQFGEMWS